MTLPKFSYSKMLMQKTQMRNTFFFFFSPTFFYLQRELVSVVFFETCSLLKGRTDQGMIRVLGEKWRNTAAEETVAFAGKVFLSQTGISGVLQQRNTLPHAGKRRIKPFPLWICSEFRLHVWVLHQCGSDSSEQCQAIHLREVSWLEYKFNVCACSCMHEPRQATVKEVKISGCFHAEQKIAKIRHTDIQSLHNWLTVLSTTTLISGSDIFPIGDISAF